MNKIASKKAMLWLPLSVIFLFACEKSDLIPEEYEVVSFGFTDIDQAKFDTIPGEYSYFKFENNTADTVQYPSKIIGIGTSLFHMPEQELPKRSNINELVVSTVLIDGKPQIHLPGHSYKFAFGKTQEQEVGSSGGISYVPPFNTLELKARYIGYAVKLHYKAILKNIQTGDQFELTGIWEGMEQTNTETIIGGDTIPPKK